MPRSRAIARSVVVVVTGLLAAPVWGLINPNFTPIHLVDQSQSILTVKVGAGPAGQGTSNPTSRVAGLDRVELQVTGALKGKAGAKVTIDLSKAPQQHAEAARKQFAAAAGEEMLLFAGRYEDKDLAYLHAQGVWLRLEAGKDGQWDLLGIDDQMPATWAGGTDMLLRCVRYILSAEGAADVPVDSGTAWRSVVKVGQLSGKAAGMAAVDLAGEGKLCLYLPSPQGDRLYRPVAGTEAFEEFAAKAKLASKSRAFAWGDFNADGRLDLASFDGKELSLWCQGADGVFAQVKPAGKAAIPPDCRGLAVVAAGKGGAPALVASGSPPLLLNLAGTETLAAAALRVPKAAAETLGKPQAALVADFTGDGIPDVLQPFEQDGLLFAGKDGGGFQQAKPCGVGCGKGGGSAVVGDFDADGWLDVLAAGAEGLRVFQNLTNGRFQESLAFSGEVAYKAQPFASGCGVCDFNNDSRQDLFIAYESQPLLLYFNRGFRSFGEAPKLELSLNEEMAELASGQQAAAFADFDGDGAQDLVVLLSNGELWCAYNDLGGPDGLCIKARLSARPPLAGPVTVSAWQKDRCLGALQVAAGSAPAFFGVREAGAYALKWRLPGGPLQSSQVTVEDKPVEVILDKAGK